MYHRFHPLLDASNGRSERYLYMLLGWVFLLMVMAMTKVEDGSLGQATGNAEGCDASVLLDGLASNLSEKAAPPNISLRASAFQIIEDLRALVHRQCGHVVSCANLATLAARDAISWSGCPEYKVPLGTRDGLSFARREATLERLPAPSSNTSVLLASPATKKFDTWTKLRRPTNLQHFITL